MQSDCASTNCFDRIIYNHEAECWVHSRSQSIYCFNATYGDTSRDDTWKYSTAHPTGYKKVPNGWLKIQVEEDSVPGWQLIENIENSNLVGIPRNIQLSENSEKIQLSNDSQIGENSMPQPDRKEIQIGKDSKLIFFPTGVTIVDDTDDAAYLSSEDAVEVANIILSRAQKSVTFNVD